MLLAVTPMQWIALFVITMLALFVIHLLGR